MNKEPTTKIISFDLPFVIFTRDSLRDPKLDEWVAAVRAGEEPPPSRYAPPADGTDRLVIGFDLPVHVPPKELAPPYVVAVRDRQVVLRFLRRVNHRKSIITIGEVLGDRTGRSSFSTVNCIVSPLLSTDPRDPDEFRFWEELAIDAVNHFIEHYRVIAERPFVQPVTPAVIQEFMIATDYGEGIERWVPTGRGSGHMNGFSGAIPDDVDSSLRLAVARPDAPDFAQTLLAEVQNHADLRTWRMALIETAVLFEVFLTSLIRFLSARNGMSASDIDDCLTQKNGLPHNVEHLAKVVLEDVSGFSFKQDHRFREWREKVASVRNDLIHGRRRHVTPEEASDAFQAAVAAKNLLVERCLGEDQAREQDGG